jgi:hypothetical protein
MQRAKLQKRKAALQRKMLPLPCHQVKCLSRALERQSAKNGSGKGTGTRQPFLSQSRPSGTLEQTKMKG